MPAMHLRSIMHVARMRDWSPSEHRQSPTGKDFGGSKVFHSLCKALFIYLTGKESDLVAEMNTQEEFGSEALWQ